MLDLDEASVPTNLNVQIIGSAFQHITEIGAALFLKPVPARLAIICRGRHILSLPDVGDQKGQQVHLASAQSCACCLLQAGGGPESREACGQGLDRNAHRGSHLCHLDSLRSAASGAPGAEGSGDGDRLLGQILDKMHDMVTGHVTLPMLCSSICVIDEMGPPVKSQDEIVQPSQLTGYS